MAGKKPPSFNQRLRRLQPWQQLAFVAALAQRAAPNYLLFCEATGFGDPREYQKLLGLLWESLLAKDARINWAVHQEKLAELEPEPDDFDVYGVYPALDAMMALELAIDQALKHDEDNAIRASKLSRSSVRQYLLLLAPEDVDEEAQSQWIREQELMADENDFQDELLSQVSAQFQPHPEVLRGIRQLARNEGVSNLGISLDEDRE
ncbi:YjaG family protein [Marinospirillum perlucidum]|uniref:YjaG family protein n=1 Tax=Marinospirillum perlucidum TaxID=1982602 RepID=UPI000DF357C4|nr:YjaG family protein [Marinospirillum perlucidum]